MRRSVALLFVAVVGLVLASGSHHNHHKNHKHSELNDEEQRGDEHYKRPIDYAPQYRQQKEYVYQYDTQISTGLSDQQQNAVQRMRAQLRLTFSNDKTAVGQLQQWQAARLNEDVHQSVNQMMSFESLRSVEIPKRHLELLEKPFEISYEQGKVKEIIFDGEDQTWSENMKRAAINTFQLQMNVEERNSMTYRVNETTVEGKCQSVYTIIPEIKCNTVKSTEGRYLEPKDKGECVQVTKSINFDLCKERPDLRYNYYRGEQMDTSSTSNQKQQRALEHSTINQVELLKDEGKHVMRFARVISHQNLHMTEKSAMMAVSITEMQLKVIKKPTQNTAELGQRKSAASLMHSLEYDEMMEKFIQEGNEDFLNKQPYLTERNVPEVLVSIAKRLAQSFVGNSQDEWSMDSSAAHQFTNLVKILRHAKKDELKTVNERLFQKSDDIQSDEQRSVVERLYNDALALAGTQPTIQHLLENIKEKKVAEREAAYALQKMARNVQVVGQESMNSVWQLCQQTKAGTDLQHACVLSWSRMANIMCGRNEQNEGSMKTGDSWVQDKKEEPRCSESLKSELIKNVQSLYDEADNNKDSKQRILALKAYGNMGIDSSIQQLEQIINNRELPRLERIVAIDSMRQLVNQIPHKIRRVLMTVFLDKREYPEVRMNAIHQVLRAQPDQPTISQIAMETLRESNINVRTFIMSEMHSLATQMRKVNPKVAQQLQNSIQLFKRTSPEEMEQIRRSNSQFKTVRTDGGHLASFAALFSNDSSLPKELMVQLGAQFGEHFIPAYFQMGLHQQDIEQLITKVFDRVGAQQMNEILVRGKRGVLDSLYQEPVQTMKKMFERLRIVARRNPNAQPSLMFYQREKNMDMWFVLIDQKNMPESLKSLMMDGEIDMSALETQGTRQLKSIDGTFMFETKVKVPTTFGVPLVLTARYSRVSAMHGSVTTELSSQGKYITSGRISLKSTPKVSIKLVQKLEAFSPLFTAGVQLVHNMDAQIPLGLDAKFSRREGLVVDFKLPEHNDRTYKLMVVSSHPSTLYREWPLKSRVYIEHEERTLYLPQLQDSFVNIDKQLYCPLSQMKIDIRGHLHNDVQGMYMGENVIEVHAHMTEKTAKIIRFQALFDSTPANGQSIQIQRLMRIFDDERKQLFQGNTKPEEVQMLKEYLNRHSTHAHQLHELDIKLLALNNKNDENPRESIELLTKALCDKDMKMCSKEMHFQMKGNQLSGSMSDAWTANMKAIVARPTVTGLHGSIRSEHVLVHAEAEFDDKKSKDVLTLCAYGRPSLMQIQQWSELKNMRSTNRQAQFENYDTMEDDEYDRMVMQQMPSTLSPKHYSFLVEYQLSPETMKQVQPYIRYSMLASKTPTQITAWALNQNEEEFMSRSHGKVKADMVIEGKQVHIQINDMYQMKNMPSWSNPSFMSSNMGNFENQMEQFEQKMNKFGNDMERFGDELGRKLSYLNRNDESSELPSGQSFGQRQALRVFGSDQTNNAKCTLDSRSNVESFDGKKYKIPLSTCYTVLAKDCGSESSPKFAILAKKQSEDNSSLKIKLLVPKKQFELYERTKGEMVIKKDGVELREDEYEMNGIHKIRETRRPTFVLHCSVTGMELRFNGRDVMIFITSDYLNKQCGVCGHYNMDSEDTLRKEDNTLASNLKEFHSSYLYRGEDNDDECTAKAQENFDQMKEEEYYNRAKFSSNSDESLDENVDGQRMRSHKQQTESQEKKPSKKHRKNKKQEKDETFASLENSNKDSSEFDSQYKKIKPVLRTKVEEEQDVICFSIQPQMACPQGSYPINENWYKNSEEETVPEVEFTCMSRHKKEAGKMMKQIRKGTHVIEELKTMRSDRRMPVKQVQNCSRQQTMPAEY